MVLYFNYKAMAKKKDAPKEKKAKEAEVLTPAPDPSIPLRKQREHIQ